MQAMAQSFDTVEQAPEFTTIKTTLYELIEAISDQVQPDSDDQRY